MSGSTSYWREVLLQIRLCNVAYYIIHSGSCRLSHRRRHQWFQPTNAVVRHVTRGLRDCFAGNDVARYLRMSVSRSECSETRLQRLANNALPRPIEQERRSLVLVVIVHNIRTSQPRHCYAVTVTSHRDMVVKIQSDFQLLLRYAHVKKAGERTKVSKQLLLWFNINYHCKETLIGVILL